MRKDVDFQEVLSKAGFTASVEALPKDPKDNLVDTPERYPDLIAFEARFANILVKGGEVVLGLNPKGIRVAAQLAHRSRIVLRYLDPEPSIGQAAVEVDATIGPATDPKTYKLEIINLAKHTKEGLWIPDIDEDEIEPLLHGFSAMPATDKHGLKDEVTLIGRHGAGIVAAIDATPAGVYLSQAGAQSITYGPDVLEDPIRNNGARGFWGTVSAGPDTPNATVPGPGEALPTIDSAEVEANPKHWARDLKIVFRSQHQDPIKLQEGRIVPNIVKPDPNISMGDAMLTQVARNVGGVKEAISRVQAAAEMTRNV